MGLTDDVWKGFRNIIVHRYGKLDDDLAFSIASENLGDFYEFISLINDHIGRQNSDKQ